jgi:hypothetical protein
MLTCCCCFDVVFSSPAPGTFRPAATVAFLRSLCMYTRAVITTPTMASTATTMATRVPAESELAPVLPSASGGCTAINAEASVGSTVISATETPRADEAAAGDANVRRSAASVRLRCAASVGARTTTVTSPARLLVSRVTCVAETPDN